MAASHDFKGRLPGAIRRCLQSVRLLVKLCPVQDASSAAGTQTITKEWLNCERLPREAATGHGRICLQQFRCACPAGGRCTGRGAAAAKGCFARKQVIRSRQELLLELSH